MEIRAEKFAWTQLLRLVRLCAFVGATSLSMQLGTRAIAFLGILLLASSAAADPIRSLPNLNTVSIFEETGGLFDHVFAANGPELTTRLGDPLSSTNNDFATTANEYYDVFYSNADGSFNIDGAFITVQARFHADSNLNGGGFNINEVQLNFAGGVNEFGDVVTSFISHGFDAVPASAALAADGDLTTWTTLGSTNDANPTDRLSVTVGFASSAPAAIPEPGSFMLLLSGFGLIAFKMRSPDNR